ncbi:hypothetical protein ACFQX6_67595 [Streptosporangium lutulentum]
MVEQRLAPVADLIAFRERRKPIMDELAEIDRLYALAYRRSTNEGGPRTTLGGWTVLLRRSARRDVRGWGLRRGAGGHRLSAHASNARSRTRHRMTAHLPKVSVILLAREASTLRCAGCPRLGGDVLRLPARR